MPSSCKRLSPVKKVKIIKDFKNKKKKTLREIGIKFGILKSSVCTIIKSREKIMKCLKASHGGSQRRLSLSKGEYPRIEKALFEWFVSQRKGHLPINGNILEAKAFELQKKIHPSRAFLASDGWLTKFKKRFGIRLLKESGEKLSSRAELVEPFKRKLGGIIEENNLSLHAIFNADESGLYWKMLPNRTYVHSGEINAPGRKMSKSALHSAHVRMQVVPRKSNLL